MDSAAPLPAAVTREQRQSSAERRPDDGRHHHQVFVSSSCFGDGSARTRCVPFPAAARPVPASAVAGAVAAALGVPEGEIRLTTAAGRALPARLQMGAGGHTFLCAGLRLLGGKGGFGSMLRAQGGRMASQKTTNFEACRDLSGRRLKTVNEAKKLADYLEKEPERRKAREEKINQKIEKGLKEPPLKKHRFEDPKFFEETEEMGEEASKAVRRVLKKSSAQGSGKQCSPENSACPQSSASSSAAGPVGLAKEKGAGSNSKPAAAVPLAMWDEDYSSSDEEEDEEDEEQEEEEDSEGKGGSGAEEWKQDGGGSPATSVTSASGNDQAAPEAAVVKSKGKGKGPGGSRKRKVT